MTEREQKNLHAGYALGFLFITGNEEGPAVVLIRKNKPEWQAGKLNGVGGKIEEGEEPIDAMRREWKEETGETREVWEQFLTLEFPKATVFCFRAFDYNTTAKTNSEEMVGQALVKYFVVGKSACSIPMNFGSEFFSLRTIPNLHWIIPMALSGETGRMKQ
jgi:8-oxo-dGTP diphosphatase